MKSQERSDVVEEGFDVKGDAIEGDLEFSERSTSVGQDIGIEEEVGVVDDEITPVLIATGSIDELDTGELGEFGTTVLIGHGLGELSHPFEGELAPARGEVYVEEDAGHLYRHVLVVSLEDVADFVEGELDLDDVRMGDLHGADECDGVL